MNMLTELPWTITASWLVVIAWAIGQMLSFAHVRVEQSISPVLATSSAPESAAEEPSAASALPIGAPPEFLAEIGLEEDHEQPTSDEPRESVYR